MRVGTFLSSRPHKATQQEEKGPTNRQKFEDILILTFRSTIRTPNTQPECIYGGPSSDTYRLCNCCFSLSEHLWALLSWFSGLCSCGVLDPTGSSNPYSFLSSVGFPKVRLMFDCGSLHLLPSLAGWSLSDGDCASFRSTSTVEHH